MALTPFQRRICRILADHRIASGESFVAGGVALNELIGAPRRSNDIDLFHDADEALEASWEADRELLLTEKFEVEPLRERPFMVGLCRSGVDELPAALVGGEIRFHPGSLRGAFPTPAA